MSKAGPGSQEPLLTDYSVLSPEQHQFEVWTDVKIPTK